MAKDDHCCDCGEELWDGLSLDFPNESERAAAWEREIGSRARCNQCKQVMCSDCSIRADPGFVCRPCLLLQRVEAAFEPVRDRATHAELEMVARRLREIAKATGLAPPLDSLSVEELRLWLDDRMFGIPGPRRVWELAEAEE